MARTGRPKVCGFRNGIREPKEGTASRMVWDMAKGSDRKAVIANANALGINPGTASTAYSEFLKYHMGEEHD